MTLAFAHNSLWHQAVWEESNGTALRSKLQSILGQLLGLAETIVAFLKNDTEIEAELTRAFVWARVCSFAQSGPLAHLVVIFNVLCLLVFDFFDFFDGFFVVILVDSHGNDFFVISLALPLGCSGDTWLLSCWNVVILSLLDWPNILDLLVLLYFGLLLCVLFLLLAPGHSHVWLVD